MVLKRAAGWHHSWSPRNGSIRRHKKQRGFVRDVGELRHRVNFKRGTQRGAVLCEAERILNGGSSIKRLLLSHSLSLSQPAGQPASQLGHKLCASHSIAARTVPPARRNLPPPPPLAASPLPPPPPRPLVVVIDDAIT